MALYSNLVSEGKIYSYTRKCSSDWNNPCSDRKDSLLDKGIEKYWENGRLRLRSIKKNNKEVIYEQSKNDQRQKM